VRESLFHAFRRTPTEQLTVLDDVSFSIARGETFGVMGRNGSGKSTLLKVLAGIYRADRGRVHVGAAVTPVLELGVGWNPELDAVDNILLVGTVMGLSLKQARAAVDEILAFAELERFANLELKHFSSGMASRLGYAVAFRVANEVILIDEIFAVGDHGFKERCVARFKELKAAGHTIVLVSHGASYVEELCDRAVLLSSGKVVALGSAQEIARGYLAANTPGA
jgi:ABC-2 type transport system ATP-binding protein